jgi:EXPERA (EXPanded EBP superfamily)
MRGKEWIRIPSIIYGSALLTVVLVILGEEIWGSHATPQLSVVLLANLPWLLFPIYIIYRMWRYPEPFTQAGVVTEAQMARPIVG